MRKPLTLMAVFAAISLPHTRAGDSPTYHRDVVPLLQRHCQECHRAEAVGPFELFTYEQARKRAADLVTVTEQKTMPPWPASTTEGGPFRDARRLTEAEIKLLSDWAAAGAPEGDPASAPAPRDFSADWPLGTPDLILKPSELYEVAPTGRDEFRVFVIPSGLTEGKWIRAVDFKPGNPKVVHHILSAFDTTGRARKLDEADPNPGYKVANGFGLIPAGGLEGWAPGKRAHTYQPGVGRYLPAGSDVLIQIHYHPSGKVETDQTAIALYFATEPIDKLVRPFIVRPPSTGLLRLRPNLVIPAGESNYASTGTFKVPYDAHIVAVLPHMHWLGKDFLLTATRPGEQEPTPLIQIDHWNFNWQGVYDFVEPVALPAGTVIHMQAHFDNSDTNPANPSHPPRTVRWGEQTTDEMCLGFLQVTRDDEHLSNQPPPRLRLKDVMGND